MIEKGPRQPIKNIVYDLGGVFFLGGATTSNDPLILPITESYGRQKPSERGAMSKFVNNLIVEHGIGLTSREMDAQIVQEFGQPLVPFSSAEIFRNDALSYDLDPQMVNILKQQREQGLRVILASNTIAEGADVMRDMFIGQGVNVVIVESTRSADMRDEIKAIEKQDKVPLLVSYAMEARKGNIIRRADGLGFYQVIEETTDIDPTRTLVLDDKAAYTAEAAQEGYLTHVFTTPDDYLTDLRQYGVFPRGLRKPGVDVPHSEAGVVYLELMKAARDTFKETHLVNGGKIDDTDLEAIRAFYQAAKAINPHTFNESTWQTNELAGKYGRLIGYHFNKAGYDFNLDELQALGLTQDFGRVFSHRRYRNDKVGSHLMRTARFRDDFVAKLPTERHWTPVNTQGEIAKNLSNIDYSRTQVQYASPSDYMRNPIQGVVELADITGKIKANGEIMKWGELNQVSLSDRLQPPNPNATGPREFLRMHVITTPDGLQAVRDFYQSLGAWAHLETGVTMEEIVDEMRSNLAIFPLRKF